MCLLTNFYQLHVKMFIKIWVEITICINELSTATSSKPVLLDPITVLRNKNVRCINGLSYQLYLQKLTWFSNILEGIGIMLIRHKCWWKFPRNKIKWSTKKSSHQISLQKLCHKRCLYLRRPKPVHYLERSYTLSLTLPLNHCSF